MLKSMVCGGPRGMGQGRGNKEGGRGQRRGWGGGQRRGEGGGDGGGVRGLVGDAIASMNA